MSYISNRRYFFTMWTAYGLARVNYIIKCHVETTIILCRDDSIDLVITYFKLIVFITWTVNVRHVITMHYYCIDSSKFVNFGIVSYNAFCCPTPLNKLLKQNVYGIVLFGAANKF